MMRNKLISLAMFCIFATTATAEVFYGQGYAIVKKPETVPDIELIVTKKISGFSVNDGLAEILRGTGYRLATNEVADPELQRLLSQPYPEHKRTLGPLALGDALDWVAGDAWLLVVDPVNKLVSFELAPRYQCANLNLEKCQYVTLPNN